MAYVLFDELPGSPTVNMDRRGGSAERSVVIDGQDIAAFYAELFPIPHLNYLGGASFPGIPWLRAEKVKFSPFQSDKQVILDDGRGNAVYALIQADVSYTVLGEDRGMQGGADPRADHSGPGGSHGSTGGNQGQDVSFVSHKVGCSGELLVSKAAEFRWATSANNANPKAEQYRLNADYGVGIDSNTTSHSITWHYVAFPPWQAIRQCQNKVNAYKFAGAPHETLLFQGCDADIEWTSQGTKMWTLTYKFEEKNNNAWDPTRPWGWNHFNRPDGDRPGTWQRLLRKIKDDKALWNGKKGVPSAPLATAMTSTSTSLILDATHGRADFPSSGQFGVMIGGPDPPREKAVFLATGVLLRGINGVKQAWPAGTTVTQWAGGPYELADMRFLFVPGIPV